MSTLTITNILDVFNSRKPQSIQRFKESAVTILLEQIQEELYIVFQVRAKDLNHQPGDICLPGGKVEGNELYKDTAIRETMEEMDLKSSDFEIIGQMDYFISPYGLILYPFIAMANVPIINYNSGEVDHIFKVPLDFFLENEPFLYKMQIGPTNIDDFPFERLNKNTKYKFSKGLLNQYFYQWNDYVIWGMTAHIIKSFINIIK